MHRASESSYKGFSITTRWSEVLTPVARTMHWFKASFTVVPPGPDDDAWQQFPDSEFATHRAAAANALREAQASIDHHANHP